MEERFAEAVTSMYEAAAKLQMSYRRLRMHAQVIAGCDLSDWTDEDVERYVGLAMEWYHNQRNA